MLRIRYVSGPTAVIELGGLRLLLDPTFDPPGQYPIGARVLTKTVSPAFGPEEAGSIDVVLLSHDQHPDNLDALGREILRRAPLVLSTGSARDRLGGTIRALPNWEHIDLPRPDGGSLRITGVPAQHGPDDGHHLLGEVTGFVLSGDDLPTVYVSGDNASLDVVRAIADRLGTVDIAVLFAGGAQTSLLGDADLTLNSVAAAEAARILDAQHVIPLHFEHWAHYTEGGETLRHSFERAGLADTLHIPTAGEELQL